jgi:hypothetical protein
MEPSILKSTKKVLGVSLEDTSFDLDVLTHINSAFGVLHQLGIGPEGGYGIDSENNVWAEYIQDDPMLLPYLSLIQTCIFLRVRLLFDPPATSYALAAMERQLQEHEWRLSTAREEWEWVDPNPLPVPDDE